MVVINISRVISVMLAFVELSVFVLILLRVRKVIGKYMELRADKVCGLDALEQSLTSVVPRLAAKVLVLELRIYNVIFKHIVKRNFNPNQFITRHDTYKFFFIGILFVSALEAVIIEVAIPHTYLVLKIVFVILSIWAVVYITGLYLGVVHNGHTLDDEGVNMRVGFGLRGFIPYNRIASVAEENKEPPSFKMSPFVPRNEPGVMYATAGEKCNVVLALKEELSLDGFIRQTRPCSIIYLSLEQPKEFIEAVSNKL
ncbi:MAG TPA: hypothetical protein VE439_11845 [Anaerolineae bacterium]|nr:hypothetical protein [Anaerolineae bacterium]